MLAPGQVTELRALDATLAGDRRQGVVSGYFDDAAKLAKAVGSIKSAKGIYFVPNPVKPALLARAENRIRHVGKDSTTSDHDVVRRAWLLVDIDAVRPSGISASEAEHEAALALARLMQDHLGADGWPDPILADSGNGAHLNYRIDLPRDDVGLVERCLAALASRFSTESAQVDKTTFNPARIWKLYGTLAGKGDSTADRPHRLAKIIEAPAKLVVVPTDLLEALAATAPATKSTSVTTSGNHHHHNGNGASFDIDAWLAEHHVQVDGPEPWQGGRRWIFATCPWNQDHTNRAAFILQHPSGAVSAGCRHNGCAGKDWHALARCNRAGLAGSAQAPGRQQQHHEEREAGPPARAHRAVSTIPCRRPARADTRFRSRRRRRHAVR